MNNNWSSRKFSALSFERQHEKAAEVVRHLYDGRDEWRVYGEMCLSLSLEFCPPTPDAISERYHFHLKRAGVQLREHRLLPQIRTGDKKEGAPFLPIALYLDGIRSAHNVGSIFRTAEALRLGKICLSPSTPTPENKQVGDAAMGADEWVEWEVCETLEDLPRPVIALETGEGAVSIGEFSFPETFTLVVGNEERGCSEAILREADHIVEIPLVGRKNSLNVANAFAIAAYAIRCRSGSLEGK